LTYLPNAGQRSEQRHSSVQIGKSQKRIRLAAVFEMRVLAARKEDQRDFWAGLLSAGPLAGAMSMFSLAGGSCATETALSLAGTSTAAMMATQPNRDATIHANQALRCDQRLPINRNPDLFLPTALFQHMVLPIAPLGRSLKTMAIPSGCHPAPAVASQPAPAILTAGNPRQDRIPRQAQRNLILIMSRCRAKSVL
jgi:hypothetical protein